MDDFDGEYEYEDEKDSGNSLADDINDAKDTYDDFKDYYNKYKDYKSSQSTPKSQVSQAPTSGTPTTGGATTSGTTVGGTATGGTTVGGAATGGTTVGGAATGGAATGGTAAGGAATGGAAAGGAAAGGTAAGGAAAGGTAAAAGGAAAGGTAAAGGAAAAGPPGWIAAAVILLLGGLKKAIEKRKKENEEQKVKRTIREMAPLLILVGIIMIPIASVVATFSVGYTVTTYDSVGRVDEFITCMESDSTCKDVTELKLEEEIDGYGKPLILFKKDELVETAENYSKFSQKYFETGEGFFTDEYTQVKEDFGIDEDYELKKEELDSAILANFLSLEARAFSRIEWIEVTWDEEKKVAVEKPIDEFDVLYSSKDDATDNGKWFTWLSPNKEEDYVIKIPKVEKYSVTKTRVEVVSSTINDEDTGEAGNVNEYQNPLPEQITDAYKKTILKSYINRVKDFLPQWYEPYAIYLATGDAKYAKRFYQEYLNLISSGKFKITVKLYHQTSKTELTTEVEIETTTSESKTPTIQKEKRKTITTSSGYNSIVFSGASHRSVLEYSIIQYEKKYDEKEEPKISTERKLLGSGTKKNEETGKEISYQTYEVYRSEETYHKYITKITRNGSHERLYTWLYEDLFGDEKYKIKYMKNDYADLRLAYVYASICKDDNLEFNIDKIGPALEIVSEYYDKVRKGSSSNTTTPGGSSGEPAQPGVINPNGGWRSTWTDDTTGITYNQYTQDRAWYSDLTYGKWGPFGSYGCPITAASIFLQGYGINIDPGTLYQKVGVANPAQAVNWYLGKNVATSLGFNKDTVISQLEAGHPVSIHVPHMGAPLTNKYTGEHYMTLIDYNSTTGQVYLSTGNTGMSSGWYDINSSGIAGLTVDTIYYIPEGNL